MKCSVFIATSADGFIATLDGGVDWLDQCGKPEVDLGDEADMGFAELIERVDCMIMGRNTIDKLASFNLAPQAWPYGELPIFGISHHLHEAPANLRDRVTMHNGNITELIEKLQQRGLQHAYVDGGKTITAFLRLQLIDEITITQAPVLLGQGIPLFGELEQPIQLEQTQAKVFANDFLQFHYRVRYR